MTISYTTPTAPTFTIIGMPTPITVDVPDLPVSAVPATVDELQASDVNARLTAYEYLRYGTLIQAVIDGEIEDFLDWSGNDAALDLKFAILKERLLFDAQTQSEAVMDNAGARGFRFLPGQSKKMLYDIDRVSKQNLSDETFKMFAENTKLGNEHLSFALQAGVAKEGALMEHHDRVQMANLDAVVEIARNIAEVYIRNAEAFNIIIADFEQELGNKQKQRAAELTKHDSFLAHMDSIVSKEQRSVRDAELFDAAIALVDLQNRASIAEIKVVAVAGQITKANLQTYHAELQEYISGIDEIMADYKLFRSQVKQKIATKDKYVKEIDVQRQEIKLYLKGLDLQKSQQKDNFARANADLEAFKNQVRIFSANLDRIKTDHDRINIEYRTDVLEYITTLRDTVQDALDSYEQSLHTAEEANRENIDVTANQVRYNSTEYTGWISALSILGREEVESIAIVAKAEVNAQSKIKTVLEHTISDLA